jgi:LSD1 subclass zinc finger protein
MRPLLIALVMAGCAHVTTRTGSNGTRVVVESENALKQVKCGPGPCRTIRMLPAGARAIRFDASGAIVGWLEDEALSGRPVARPRPDGVDARRFSPDCLFVGDAWTCAQDGCLVGPLAPESPICGDALRPLAFDGTRLVIRTNAALRVVGPRPREWPLTDVLDASLGPDATLLVLRRDNSGSSVKSELFVIRAFDEPVRIFRAPILGSPVWDGPDHALIIRADGGLIDDLLAHAPDEFGGEATGGELIRIDLNTGGSETVRALAGRRVRAIAR